MTPQQLGAEARAAVIAHAIRLGKCPAAGQIVGGNMRMSVANLGATEMVTDKHPFEFQVTQDDIDRAIVLINEQRAVYSEPKITMVRLGN